MNTKKRLICFIAGVIILALGLTFNTKSMLGVSAINSLPNALSLVFPLSLGNFITLMYCVFITLQFLMIRKFDIKLLGQLPFSFVFGYLIDLARIIVPSQTLMPLRVLYLVLGILLTAFGVTLMVIGDYVLNPADGMVNTISQVFHKPFSNVKNLFDLSMCLIATLVAIVFNGNVFDTIGIGTILSALLIGRCIGIFQKQIKRIIE